MIKGITQGRGVYVRNGTASSTYIDMSRPSAGMIRYNGNNLEVYDGSGWLVISSTYAEVELDGLTMEILDWARHKMEEERHLKHLADKHPAVADALQAVAKAEEQVRIVAALVETE